MGLLEIKRDAGIANIIKEEDSTIIVACSTLICGPRQRIPQDYPKNAHLKGFIYVPETPEEDISEQVRSFFS